MHRCRTTFSQAFEKITTLSGKQALVATHSAEILRNAEPTDVMHIRGSSKGPLPLRGGAKGCALSWTWIGLCAARGPS